jgi:5-methylcytosine-specific restriction enzyme A
MPTGVYLRTEETKKKIALAFTGRRLSEETKKKLSLAFTGRKMSEEQKKKISIANKGKINKGTFKKGQKSWNAGTAIYLICKQCGKHFIPQNYNPKQKYCSIKCAGLAQSGENNPSWNGGKSFEPYSIDWTETLRRSIRERDRYTCQMCGKLQTDRAFCVHHIDYNKKNDNPNNLITLCLECHLKTNINRNYWQNYFKSNMITGLGRK